MYFEYHNGTAIHGASIIGRVSLTVLYYRYIYSWYYSTVPTTGSYYNSSTVVVVSRITYHHAVVRIGTVPEVQYS